MTYQPIMRFDFSRDGHANRRDDDALPRVLLTAIHSADRMIHVHFAGDQYVREVPTLEAVHDDDLIAGLEPADALRVGAEWQRLRDPANEEKAAGR